MPTISTVCELPRCNSQKTKLSEQACCTRLFNVISKIRLNPFNPIPGQGLIGSTPVALKAARKAHRTIL